MSMLSGRKHGDGLAHMELMSCTDIHKTVHYTGKDVPMEMEQLQFFKTEPVR